MPVQPSASHAAHGLAICVADADVAPRTCAGRVVAIASARTQRLQSAREQVVMDSACVDASQDEVVLWPLVKEDRACASPSPAVFSLNAQLGGRPRWRSTCAPPWRAPQGAPPVAQAPWCRSAPLHLKRPGPSCGVQQPGIKPSWPSSKSCALTRPASTQPCSGSEQSALQLRGHVGGSAADAAHRRRRHRRWCRHFRRCSRVPSGHPLPGGSPGVRGHHHRRQPPMRTTRG